MNETDNTGALATPTIDGIGTNASARVGSVFFVGKTSVILRYGGFTILTDPNFLHQANRSLTDTDCGRGAGPSRCL